MARGATPVQSKPNLTAFLRPIAHRGLHDRRQGRIENTAPAFLAAIDKSYGIECDLQAAADGTITVARSDIYNGKIVPFVAFTKLEGDVIKGTHFGG